MLNKELMFTKGKDISDILVGVVPWSSGDDGNMWPSWFPTESDPFWEFAPGEQSSNIELLTNKNGTHLWIANPTNAKTTRTLTFTNVENGLTATFIVETGRRDSNSVAGDALGLSDYAYETVRMKVFPPPDGYL